MLVEPAPIPPHERSWRHPSELVSAEIAPEPETRSRRVLALATGAVAATLVVVLTITVLPKRAPAPVAMSSTTMPPFSVSAAAVADDAAQRSSDAVRLEASALASPAGLALTGAPRSIAAPLVAESVSSPDDTRPSGTTVAAVTDAPPAVVHLVTDSHVYRIGYDDLQRTLAPDGTIVLDAEGRVIGSFVDGRFVAD